MEVAPLLVGALAGNTATVCVKAAILWWRRVSGERYSHEQELRYEAHRVRLADMPALVDGAPPTSPWLAPSVADADAWGSNDSPITLTRERRALGLAIDRALERRRLEEGHLPLASPEAYALCALRRWCVALDRTQPPDDLHGQLAGLQRWLSRAISDLRASRARALMHVAALASSERELRSVRSALLEFGHAADAKRSHMRLAHAREQICGCAHQALVAAGAALYAAYDEVDEPAPRQAARELLLELRPPAGAAASANPSWRALVAPVVGVLLAGGAVEDEAALIHARRAAQTLGAESAPLCDYLRALTRAPPAGAGALAAALQTAWLALLDLAERVARFERSCATCEGAASASERVHTACAQLLAAHAVAGVARSSLFRVLRDLDREAGAAREAQPARRVSSWLGALVAGHAAQARVRWLANADGAQVELTRALGTIDKLADALAAALHGLQALGHVPSAELLTHAPRRLAALELADEPGGEVAGSPPRQSSEPLRKRARAADAKLSETETSGFAGAEAVPLHCDDLDEDAPKRRARRALIRSI
jgi:hypothetical protein